ncbi:MAG: hypothetical protein IT324_19820 [Anaerolineae bacterium]|nr:hypothetical protein [Anaerolineae bacterium]
MNNSSPTNSPAIEQLSPTLSREWIADGHIVVYTLQDGTRTTIDRWVKAFTADIAAWPEDRPFLVIHDFSARQVTTTPYGREGGDKLVNVRPEVKGRVAVLLPKTIAAHLIRLFLDQHTKGGRERRIFTSREDAIKWLLN